MRYLKDEPSGVDNEVLCPVFKMNYREVEILYSILNMADTYIPETQAIMPDRSRIRQMRKVFGNYIRKRKTDKRRLRIKVNGDQEEKLVVITHHAQERMLQRGISLEDIEARILLAEQVSEDSTARIFEHEDMVFIMEKDDEAEALTLITVYKKEEYADSI